MQDTENHQPKEHIDQFSTLGQGQLSVWKVQNIWSNFYTSSVNATAEQGVLMSDCGKDIYTEIKAAAESKTTREPKNTQERKCQNSLKGMESSFTPKNNCNRIDQALISR